MNSKLVKIHEIKMNPSNPRIIKDHKFKQLVQSIKGFPQMLEIRPIVVNEDMIVLGGNMRLKACQEAGLKEVPIIVVDNLDSEQQREFIIKDNLGFGEWDWDMLANEWDVEQLSDWGLDTIKQDWNQLEYIEEAERPEFNKQNTITVIVPTEFTDEVKDIEELIKSVLSDKYSGCEVK